MYNAYVYNITTGTAQLNAFNYAKNAKCRFFVVQGDSPTLLGLTY